MSQQGSGGTGALSLSQPLATGTGPWPGSDPLEAARTVFGELSGDGGLPFLPQLPDRGPGGDAVGRTAALLVELPVDLQPTGWRLVDHPGRDAWRAGSMWTADTDALAEVADGWAGPLQLQVLGPWTLASSVWLPRGERAVVDAGARRDLVTSLAQGVAAHVQDVVRLVPGAAPVLLVDEPSLPAVVAGRVPTASGWGRLPAVEAPVVRAGLEELVAAVGCPVVLRCGRAQRYEQLPLGLLREVGAAGIATDATGAAALGATGWESLATAVDAGQVPSLGVLDPAADLPAVSDLLEAVRRPWREVGLDTGALARVVLTPAGGLSATSPDRARAVLARLRETAVALAEVAAGG